MTDEYARLANRFRRGDTLSDAELRQLHDFAVAAENYLLSARVYRAWWGS